MEDNHKIRWNVSVKDPDLMRRVASGDYSQGYSSMSVDELYEKVADDMGFSSISTEAGLDWMLITFKGIVSEIIESDPSLLDSLGEKIKEEKPELFDKIISHYKIT